MAFSSLNGWHEGALTGDMMYRQRGCGKFVTPDGREITVLHDTNGESSRMKIDKSAAMNSAKQFGKIQDTRERLRLKLAARK